MDDLQRELLYLIVTLLALVGSGVGLLTWSQRKYATMNALQSESWLNTQKALSDHLNAQISERVKAEDGRLDEKEHRITLELALAQVKGEHATTTLKVASLEAEVARVNRINTDVDAAVKEIGGKLATVDDERKLALRENSDLKNTIAGLEKRITDLERERDADQKVIAELRQDRQADQKEIATLRAENATLKERLDAFENERLLEERPISKPSTEPLTIEGKFKVETPEGDSAA